MAYEIIEKHLDEQPVIFMRKRIRPQEIAAALGELFPAVHQFSVRNGIVMAGPPFCRYRELGAEGMTLEAGMPISAPAEGEGDVLAGALPAGRVASTIHAGPYDDLPQAHAAIEAWLEEHELSGGDAWEVYLTDPGLVEDPADWRTEVLRPIETAPDGSSEP